MENKSKELYLIIKNQMNVEDKEFEELEKKVKKAREEVRKQITLEWFDTIEISILLTLCKLLGVADNYRVIDTLEERKLNKFMKSFKS